MTISPLNLSPEAAAELLDHVARNDNLDALHNLLHVDKADPNSVTRNGQTILHVAAQMGHDRVITMLLEAGADVHKTDAQGRSILRAAIKVGDVISVKKLLEAGADPTATAKEDNGVVLTDAEVSVGHGAEVSSAVMAVVNKYNVNRAAREKNLVWIENLMNRKVSPDTIDRFGKTALAEAIEADFAEGVDALLKNKADPGLRMKNGWLAMHFAAASKNPEMVAKLFRAGAKAGLGGPSGLTPLQVAKQKGNQAVIDALEKYLKMEETDFARRASQLSRAVIAPQPATFRKKGQSAP